MPFIHYDNKTFVVLLLNSRTASLLFERLVLICKFVLQLPLKIISLIAITSTSSVILLAKANGN